eukprot:6600680-Prymnesium_polylepis.1
MVDRERLKVFSDRRYRCDGVCPEEQVILQLRAQSLEVVVLPWSLCMKRLLAGTPIATLLSPRPETCVQAKASASCVRGSDGNQSKDR